MRWNGFSRPRSSAAVAILLAAMPLSAAGAVDRERARELTALVRQDCGSCHGMTLKGGLGKALLPEAIAHIEAEGLAAIILEGIPGTPMPSWRGELSVEDARWIAERLKEGFPR